MAEPFKKLNDLDGKKDLTHGECDGASFKSFYDRLKVGPVKKMIYVIANDGEVDLACRVRDKASVECFG